MFILFNMLQHTISKKNKPKIIIVILYEMIYLQRPNRVDETVLAFDQSQAPSCSSPK